MDAYDDDGSGLQLQLAAGPATAGAAAGGASVVTAEERQLQLDFHALLADYIVGRRRVEAHPDAEQRYGGVCFVGVGGGGGEVV